MDEGSQQGGTEVARGLTSALDRVSQTALIRDSWLVVRYTRRWLHYGVIAFAVLCSLIAAVRGALAR
jgi:hypothetical protein